MARRRRRRRRRWLGFRFFVFFFLSSEKKEVNWKTLRVPDQSSYQTFTHSLTLLPRRLDASIDAEEKKMGCLVGAPLKTCSSLSKVTRRFFLGELLRRRLLVVEFEFEFGNVDETLRIPRGIFLSGLRFCTRLTIF